ncbi:MAG: hypothetical protein ACOYEQ_02880 [Bacillota bacterium]|jgi:predicted nucleotidyltransferase
MSDVDVAVYLAKGYGISTIYELGVELEELLQTKLCYIARLVVIGFRVYH